MIINDSAILLNMTPFQERMLIAECFSKNNGLLKGVIKASKKELIHKIQPGDFIHIIWNARLGSHLGTLKIEIENSIFSHIFHDQCKTLYVTSIISLLKEVLNEHESTPYLYHLTKNFLETLIIEQNFLTLAKNFILLELAILNYSGFGLDLSECVVTKSTEDLKFISPKSGCAVSHNIGQPYQAKLFKMPEFFNNSEKEANTDEIYNAFKIIEHFFKQRVYDNKYSIWPFSCTQLDVILKNMVTNNDII